MFIGVDPGKSGAIAFLNDIEVAGVLSLDCSPHDIAEALDDHAMRGARAVVEIPGAQRPGCHKLWYSYGLCIMALAMLEIPYEEVSPSKWMRAMGAKAKKPPHTKHNLALAQKYFPSAKATKRNADALLIALYCQRLWRNEKDPDTIRP